MSTITKQWLQHGFSLGQTDNKAGFEECLSAYGTGKGE